MKFRLLLCFALIASLTTSCVQTVDPTPEIVFTCKIDGADSSFPGSAAVLLQSEMGEFLSLTISASTINLDPSSFGIILTKDFAVGSYDIAADEALVAYATNTISNAMSYDGVSGNLTITEIDTENSMMKGTFSMTLELIDDSSITLDVTEGVFDIPYSN